MSILNLKHKMNIPYGKQDIDEDDINAVVEVLKSNFLTQGPQVANFEMEFANYVDSKYAIAVSNGTAALHLSILALELKKNDKVITSPITFAASANCIKYGGGEVFFCDIDKTNYTIDLNKIEDLLKKDLKNEIKGIIPVNYAGFPINTEELKSLANKYNLWVLVDACHSPGASFIDSSGILQKSGNGLTDASVFSFHPVKHITSGEGGMITTNNKKLYEKLILLRSHGITKDPNILKENHGKWYYELTDLGFNYRLTDIQAALGRSQLKKAKKNISRRIEIAKIYNEELIDLPLQLPVVPQTVNHAFHLYVIKVQRRKELYNFLNSIGVNCQVHYIPLHLMPYYKNLGFKKGDFPIAEEFYSSCLSIPMFPSLKETEQIFVIENIKAFFK